MARPGSMWKDRIGGAWESLRGMVTPTRADGGAVDNGRVPLRSRSGGGRVSAVDYVGGTTTTTAYPPGGLDTFLRMQRDAQVRACLTTKRLSVLSKSVEVHPADDSASARASAAMVTAAVKAIPGGWGGIALGALDALAMGYSVGEYIWGLDGQLLKVFWHDPRRFQFMADAYGDVNGLAVLDSGQELGRGAFVLWAHQAKYGNPYGESDLVAAYRPWSEKDLIQRMWLTALDRFGAPVPVARVPISWGQEDIDQLSATLAKLQNESCLVVTNDVEIDAKLDAGRVEPAHAFVTATQEKDTQIARSILGQELTTQGSSGGSGSYALGQVHQDVQTDWIEAIRADLGECVLTGQVAAKLCEMMMPGAPVPRVAFSDLSAEELAARRDLLDKLLSGQVVAPSESWIRRWIGIPEAMPGEYTPPARREIAGVGNA
jgi:phage gp29-like protein